MKKTLLSIVLCIYTAIILFPSTLHAETTYAIEPQYEAFYKFNEGLAAVKKDGQWGYIDKAGNVVINYQFEDADEFSEGLAGVKLDGKWGFIDKSGNIVIKPQFGSISSFRNGVGGVLDYDIKKSGGGSGKYDFIDRSGNKLKDFLGYREFISEGMKAVKKNNTWGFSDASGKIVIEPQFTDVRIFKEGYAAVLKGGKWGFINTTGNMVITPIYDDILVGFNEGLAGVKKDGKWGFIDKSGNLVVNYQDYEINELGLKNGFIYINAIDTKGRLQYRGVIDKTGKMIVTPNYYNDIREFGEGLAVVSIREKLDNGNDIQKYGYIDESGNLSIPMQYDLYAGSFYDGVAIVGKRNLKKLPNGEYSYGDYYLIDKTGTVIRELSYDFVGGNNYGLINVKKDGIQGCIDVNGNEVIDLQFDYIWNYHEDLIPVKLAGKVGFVDNPFYTPDIWAQEEINSAIAKKLIPEQMQKDYKTNINRQDFCALIVNLYEIKTGKSIDKILNEKGLSINSNPLTDTSNKTILVANKLGIVNGKGSGRFDPYGRITRQEAAVMLANTAKVLDVDVSADSSNFNDSNNIAGWAKSQVDYVSSKGIMNGYNSNFDPNGNYTKQQAYLTVFRLFNVINN